MERLVHIAMALLVLASSSGIVFNKHYCRGELRSQALFFKPENCHAASQESSEKPPCPFHAMPANEGAQDNANGCCDNRSSIVKSDMPQWHVQSDVIPLIFPPFFATGLLQPWTLFNILSDSLFSLPDGAGGLPPPKCGLHVLLQVFLN